MRSKVLDEILLSEQRYAVADLLVQVTERARDDMMPFTTTWEFFQQIMIMRTMYELHERDKEIHAGDLARATTIPLATIQTRLHELLDWGAIEQRGNGYVLAPNFFNSEFMLRGFRLRRLIIKVAPEKMEEPDRASG